MERAAVEELKGFCERILEARFAVCYAISWQQPLLRRSPTSNLSRLARMDASGRCGSVAREIVPRLVPRYLDIT
jgi:hypothetical protein